MPSTPTSRLRLELQATGENLNSWGTRLNAVENRAEEAIAGVATIALTGATYTLNTQNYVADEARMAVLVFTGTLTGPYTITAPQVQKAYGVVNRTNQPVIFTSGASGTPTTATIRAGMNSRAFCDGTNFYVADPTLDQVNKATATVDLNGQKITGLAAPTAASDAATRAYALSTAAAAVASLDNVGPPTIAYGFGGQRLANLGTGTAQTDAVTLAQLQAQVFTIGATPAATSVGQVPRWNGSGYAPGAVDLANTNAVTGLLPLGSGGTGANSAPMARTALGLGSAAVLTAGVAPNNAVQLDGNAKLPAVDASALVNTPRAPDFIAEDQKPLGTSGGSSTATGFDARTLNTVVRNVIAGASLATNQVTLPAGTYVASFWGPNGATLGRFQARLYNVTDSAVIFVGSSENASGNSMGTGVFTLAGSKTIRLEQYCSSMNANGFGAPANQGIEVYARLHVWKIS